MDVWKGLWKKVLLFHEGLKIFFKKFTMLTYLCKGVGFLAGPMITVPVAVVPTSSSLFESSLDISRSMERWLREAGIGYGNLKINCRTEEAVLLHKIPWWTLITPTSLRPLIHSLHYFSKEEQKLTPLPLFSILFRNRWGGVSMLNR